jgi:recombination protein RecA
MAKSKKELTEEVKTTGNSIAEVLNNRYGKGTIILGSDKQEELEVIDSGSITLNKALEIGGIPIGKLIEMYGFESAGKSTLALHIIAGFQKAGKKVALIDGEQSFARGYAQDLGVKVEELLISQPDSGEQGYNIAIELIKSGEISLVVIDSHTSLLPQKVVDSIIGDATIALQARVNSVAIGKIHPLLAPNKCTLLSISQLRTNIGSMGYGDPNIPTGGNAYKFYSDIRLKISKVLEKEDSTNRTTVEVVKNKCGIPFGKATFAIIWGKGIDRVGEIIDLSIKNGSIKRAGAWYEVTNSAVLAGSSGETYEAEGVVKLNGEARVKQYLLDNPEILAQLEANL